MRNKLFTLTTVQINAGTYLTVEQLIDNAKMYPQELDFVNGTGVDLQIMFLANAKEEQEFAAELAGTFDIYQPLVLEIGATFRTKFPKEILYKAYKVWIQGTTPSAGATLNFINYQLG